MKKLTSMIAAALTLAACDAKEDPADQYRAAMPKNSAVQIHVPDGEAAGGAQMAAGGRFALGQAPGYLSEYAITSYWTAVTVNVGVWWTLELLQFITAFPPSQCDDGSCTWGPWLGDQGLNYYKLHVEKVDGSYDYALSGQSAAAGVQPWVELISGNAVPGADRDHGRGTFRILFDEFDELQHADPDWKKDHGTLTVSYDNTSGLFVHADFVNARNDDPDRLDNVMNAAYEFVLGPADGDLQIVFEDATAGDSVSLHTRWKRHDGAGRGDLRYVPVGGGELVGSECWNGEHDTLPWAEVYDTSAPDATGAEENCDYLPAEYATLTIPAAQ
jgi:hypothetical protein